MAYPNLVLVCALRQAARRLREGAPYSWGHHGSCNCGHLLQVVTHLSKEEILKHAHTGKGEWTEIAEDYCPVSSVPAYMLIGKLEAIGLTPTDIHYLEYLKDRTVLDRLPGGFRWLQKNRREDVILYFETFAHMLEEQLCIPPLTPLALKGARPRVEPLVKDDYNGRGVQVQAEETAGVLV